jgi:hypothetical protein
MTRVRDFQEAYNDFRQSSVLPENGELDPATIDVIRSGWLPPAWGVVD